MPTAPQSTIGVRDATPSDLRFVRRLAVDSILHGIPYGRKVPNQAVQARVRESVKDLEPTEDVLVLVAFSEQTSSPMGYLILQTDQVDAATGDRQSNIFDLAVHPRHWGTPAVRCLVREAAKRTAAAGLLYMAGEVSAHNRRTYLQALRLGFELERYKIVMHCGEDGPLPLPERDPNERAYDQSRRRR